MAKTRKESITERERGARPKLAIVTKPQVSSSLWIWKWKGSGTFCGNDEFFLFWWSELAVWWSFGIIFSPSFLIRMLYLLGYELLLHTFPDLLQPLSSVIKGSVSNSPNKAQPLANVSRTLNERLNERRRNWATADAPFVQGNQRPRTHSTEMAEKVCPRLRDHKRTHAT